MARRRARTGRGRVVSKSADRMLIWTSFSILEVPTTNILSSVILNHGSWAVTQGFERATIRRIVMFTEYAHTTWAAGTLTILPSVSWGIRLGTEEEPATTLFQDDPVYFDEEDVLQFGVTYPRMWNAATVALSTSAGSPVPHPNVTDIRVMRRINADHELMLDSTFIGADPAEEADTYWRAYGRILVQLGKGT